MNSNLTPKERNRIRQMRDLLSLYETSESSRPIVVDNLLRATNELEAARAEAHAAHMESIQERTRQAVASVKAMGESIDRSQDFAEAHAEGMHDDLPREGCPECP